MNPYIVVVLGVLMVLALAVLASEEFRQQIKSEFGHFDRGIAVIALIGISGGIPLLSGVFQSPDQVDGWYGVFRFALGVSTIVTGIAILAVMSYFHWRDGES